MVRGRLPLLGVGVWIVDATTQDAPGPSPRVSNVVPPVGTTAPNETLFHLLSLSFIAYPNGSQDHPNAKVWLTNSKCLKFQDGQEVMEMGKEGATAMMAAMVIPAARCLLNFS